MNKKPFICQIINKKCMIEEKLHCREIKNCPIKIKKEGKTLVNSGRFVSDTKRVTSGSKPLEIICNHESHFIDSKESHDCPLEEFDDKKSMIHSERSDKNKEMHTDRTSTSDSEFLEKIYDELIKIKGGDWYILSTKDLDILYEDIMEYTGAYNKKTNTFIDGNNWSDLAHKMSDIFWKWYMYQIKKKLDIMKYYEKYYGNSEEKNE